LRGDDGFEDREGHQAPFTLRIAERKENIEHRTPHFERRSEDQERCERLFKFLNRADDSIEIRPVARVEFGMEEFAIGANLESAAARWNQRERFIALAELKNFGRQTDGLRRVVSNYAVFDRHLGFHQRAPFRGERIGVKKAGQAVEALDIS
jgi:hypothetical protein